MIQYGMRAHDASPKGSVTEVLDNISKLKIHYIQLAMSKSFTDVDTSPGHFSAGLGDYIGEELRKRNLHVAVLGCYINPANPDEEKRLLAVKRFTEHLKYAKLLGADVVGTETGRASVDMKVVPETDSEENYQRMLDTFKRIRTAAEKLGVMVAVEGVYNHTLSTPQKMARFLSDIDSPNFDVILDGVNLIPPALKQNPEGQDQVIREAFQLYGDRISVLHLKDGDYTPEGGQLFCHAGEGYFHYDALMQEVGVRKPYIVGLLENSTPERFQKDCDFLEAQYHRVNG